MDAHDAFELDAAFESIPLIDVGEFARLRIRVRNAGDDLPGELRVEVRADPNVLLVSANPWRCGDGADGVIAFARAPLWRDEKCEIAVDVYAVGAGESSIAVRARCEDVVRELELRCACEGAAAFEASANRLELFSAESGSGAEVSGRIVITNTGTCAARVQLGIEGLEDVRFDSGAALDVMPARRVSSAFAGRLPHHLPDGSPHEVRAFLTHDSTEVMLGTAIVSASSRPLVNCELQARGDEWLLHVRNDGERVTALAIGGVRVADLAPGATIVLPIASSPETATPQRVRAALEPAVVRHLQALTGFVRHVWAIAVLFGDATDGRSAGLLAAARTALRSVFDRLLIKLRMPQYPLHADDVLDRPAREALCALGAAVSADLPSMLDHAASFIDGEEDVRAYRAALRARLCALRDDGMLIAALTGADTELDALLDAILTAARLRMSA